MKENLKAALIARYNAPKHGMQNMKAWEQNHAHALISEEHYRTILAALPEESAWAKRGLADALTRQGRYEEALEYVAKDSEEAGIIKSHMGARDRNDLDWCDCSGVQCEPARTTEDSRTVGGCACGKCPQLSGKLWSESHDRWVNVWVCPSCQGLNYTPENQVIARTSV